MALAVVILISCFSYAKLQESNLTNSMQRFEQAFLQAKNANDQRAILKIGLAYPKMLMALNTAGDREKAAQFFVYFEHAQEQLEPNPVIQRVATLVLEAENYSDLQQLQNAIESNDKALALIRTTNHSALDIVRPLSQLGHLYMRKEDHEKALYYYNQAKEEAKTAKTNIDEVKREIAFNTSYEADMDRLEEKYTSAIEKYRQAINYPWKPEDQRWLPSMYGKLAECYQRLNQTDNAKQALRSALSGAQKSKLAEIDEYKRRLDSLSNDR